MARTGGSEIKKSGAPGNLARADLCKWIHAGGAHKFVRPLNADERDLSLGFPPGSSKLPEDQTIHKHGEEFERGNLTGNAWSPPAAAHVLGHLAKHILEGATLETNFVLPKFVSSQATLDLLQPEDAPPAQKGGEGPPVASARPAADPRPSRELQCRAAPSSFDEDNDAIVPLASPPHDAPALASASAGSTHSAPTTLASGTYVSPEYLGPFGLATQRQERPSHRKGSPVNVLEEGMKQHFETIQAMAQPLASDDTNIPGGFAE